jgi:hypothetical protein
MQCEEETSLLYWTEEIKIDGCKLKDGVLRGGLHSHSVFFAKKVSDFQISFGWMDHNDNFFCLSLFLIGINEGSEKFGVCDAATWLNGWQLVFEDDVESFRDSLNVLN